MQQLSPQQPAIRNDPAPSRWSYRLQRWMLTPGLRQLLRYGVPTAVVAIIAMGWLSSGQNYQRLQESVAGMRDQLVSRPEFSVHTVSIEGVSARLDADIRRALPLALPVSSFEIDLPAIQKVIAEMPAVRRADIRVRSGGVLEIAVTERVPALVWRTRDGVRLLDETGVAIAEIQSRQQRGDLPLVAGAGADVAVGEALELVRAAAPLAGRMRGFLRVGERRWDVILDRNQRIMLPAEDPVPALERAIALNGPSDMLARDIAVVDMRLSERPTIRMSPVAAEQWRETVQNH